MIPFKNSAVQADALKISVLVLAYNRQDFLKEAIDSVLNQTLPGEFYEIVLVKNFDFQYSDNLQEGGLLKNVFSNQKSMGKFIVDGMNKCNHEIIAFLEDDDLWEPDRLEKIHEIFLTNSELCYYHNSVIHVDVNGNPISFGSGHEVGAWGRSQNSILLGNSHKKNYINKIGRYFPDFNLSSIVLRVSFYNDSEETLSLMDTAVDTYLFFVALNSKGSILLDPSPLTKYRHHGQSQSGGESSDIEKYLRSLYNFSSRALPAYETIRHYVNSNEGSRKVLSGPARRRVKFTMLLNSIQNPQISRLRTLRLALSIIPVSIYFNRSLNIRAIFLGFLYVVWPSKARNLLATHS